MPAYPLSAGPRATRARILAGAGRVFVEKGVRAATIEDVLVASGVSRRTFYQYFKGRDDVLEAMYDDVVAPVMPALVAVLGGFQSPLARVDAGLDTYLDHVQRGGPLLWALLAEAARSDSPIAARREDALDAVVDLLDRNATAALGEALDPFVWRALVLGIEGLVLHTQRAEPFSPRMRARVGGAARALLRNVLTAHTLLPRAPARG